MNRIPILTEADALKAFADRLAARDSIAVDLEADSMHHYREQVCLLQFTAGEETVLVDPLRLPDLSPLGPVLADPAIRKLFHAADYDLRCLRRDFGLEVRGLFDTMIASQFCGEERFGLADLLQKYFGVELDKRFQRADWTTRPLPADMAAYAAEDTRHLHRLAELLEGRLRELGRLEWVAEECRLMEEVAFEEREGPFFLRFKGASRMDPRQLGILEELLVWRDQEAERRDRPPFKVLGNQPLAAVAQNAPRTLNELKKLDGLFPKLAERYGRTLLSLVETGLAIPVEELPRYPRNERQVKDPAVERRLISLKEWRSGKATELGLDPGVLINNALLEQVAKHCPRSETALAACTQLKNWQRREFGNDLMRLVIR